MAAGLALAVLTLPGCAIPVDCDDEGFEWVAEPDVAFVGRAASSTAGSVTFAVVAVTVGDPPNRLEVVYPDPALLHVGEQYQVRARDDGDGRFESVPFCGATRHADGRPVDTTWMSTMRARLPMTPLMGGFIALLFGAAFVGLRRMSDMADERLRSRWAAAEGGADAAGPKVDRSSGSP